MVENKDDKPTIKRATVRPSPTASVVQLVMGIIFLFFGVFLIGGSMGEAEEAAGPMVFFLIIWVIACLAIVVYSIVNLASFRGQKISPSAMDVVDIEHSQTGGSAQTDSGEMDFETRLRKLDRLRKDGLLTEEEYRLKKQEILSEKW